MIIDSGFRCHLTSFARATADTPSAFVTRLRKYLRTRRVTSVSQVGTDRIVEIQFSEGQYRLFLEFYAGGNIVLADEDLVILSLLRIVGEGAEQEELRVGLKYSLSNRQNYNGVPALTEERVRNGLQKLFERADVKVTAAQKPKKKSGDALRKALATSLNEFPPMLIDHALRATGFDPSTGVEEVLKENTVMHRLMLVLEEAQKVINDIMSMATPTGYIIAKTLAVQAREPQARPATECSSEITKAGRVLYEDFHPFLPKQFEDNSEFTVLEFDGFNRTVDEFFSSIEGQKLESRLSEREENANKKLVTARQDHNKRLGGLQQAQETHIRKAQAIEANLQQVQEAVSAINGLVAQGMDWVEIARLIEMEQARNNPVAQIIKLPLKLYENTATLLLEEARFDDEDFEGNETDSDVEESEDEESAKLKRPQALAKPEARLTIDIDLSLSPWSNARQYYEQKKVAAVKEQKTLQSSEKALKNTEKKINSDLKKGLKQEKQVLRPVRQQLWFEKFNFFISSENYLVLGGRDAQQNEILYKRYLRKGDVYVHADLQGAASVVIKNIQGLSDDPIPPSTLSQAGTLAVATSSAWDSKAVMSAWWVNAEQVSKISPAGDYLAVGGFAIKGQKNFLPPAQLVLGFGIMFHISEESKARHLKHRMRDVDFALKGNLIHDSEVGREGPVRTDDSHENESEVDHTDNQVDSDSEHEDNSADISTYNASIDDEDDQGPDLDYHNPLQPGNTNRDGAHRPKAEVPEVASQELASEAVSTMSGDDKLFEAEESEAVLGQPKGHDVRVSSSEGYQSHRQDRAFLQPNSPQLLPKPCTEQSLDQNPVPICPDSASTSAAKQFESIGGGPKQPYVRGKRGKYNKMKTKYANQDEEDRALALRLLGSKAGQEKSQEAATAKKDREQHLAAQKQRRQQQHAVAAEKGKEIEEKRQQRFQEGTETLYEDTVQSPVDLHAFVGSLMPGDEVLDALVMCGPWDAIGGRSTWRAKLQPGTVKKGKAVREILGKWVSVVVDREKKKRPGSGNIGNEAMVEEEKVRRREGDLLRNLREQEVVGVVPVSRCRVVMGGGVKAGGSKSGNKGGAAGKGKRGGKGSKRQR